MDPVTILTALLPAATDGVRALINKFTGGAGAEPANVEEAVQLMEAETSSKNAEVERFKAVSEAANVENVSQWVNNVRAMQRPVAVVIILSAWVAAAFVQMPVEIALGIANMASAVTFYLFGERGYLKVKQMLNK